METMTAVTAAMAVMTPFLVPLSTATLIVAASTTVLVRRDRRRAHAYRCTSPAEED